MESLGVSSRARALSAATCGMGSNLKTCGLGANIGYANRIQNMGGWWEDYVAPAIDKLGDAFSTALDAFLGRGKFEALKAAGYKFDKAVDINYEGKRVSAVIATRPDGRTVAILQDGREIDYTSDLAQGARTFNPETGKFNPTTTALIIGGVALVAVLLVVMSRRR